MWLGEYETKDGAIYQVRGLTIGEKTELASNGAFEIGVTGEYLRAFSAERGILSWRKVPDYDHHGNQRRGQDGFPAYISEDASITDLPYQHLMEVGEYIFHELSTITDDEEKKLRGLIRFKFWFGEEHREKYRETFNCSFCVEKGYDRRRKCGLDDEKKDIIRAQIAQKKEQERIELERKQNDRIHRALDRRRSRKRRVTINKPSEDKIKVAQGHLSILGFVYEECPMSWIPTGMKHISDYLYYGVKNGQLFVQGALFDQPAKMWEAGRILVSEGATVESKMMEKRSGSKH